MPDKVAVIASVLKPLDDTRMYEKLGRSIRETNKYRVNIIGFDSKKPITDDGITFHTLYKGNRSSIQRLLAGWMFFRLLLKLKPALIITCTPELLLPASLYKTMYGPKLWYDVQENYRRNIQYQAAYPSLLKPFLSVAIGLIEFGTRPLVDHYLLAEKGYLKELTFVTGKNTVLENKYVPSALAPTSDLNPESSQHNIGGLNPEISAFEQDLGTNDSAYPLQEPEYKVNAPYSNTSGTDSRLTEPGSATKLLVFSGTCSKENGILQAISLVTRLQKQGKPVRLQIVGHVPDPEILELICRQQEQQGLSRIQLIGNGELVPHQAVLKYAVKADFGLVAHQPNPSNENCIPTKIYEYLGLQIPMILQQHRLWNEVVAPYSAALFIDYQNFDSDIIWKQMQNTQFYTTQPGSEILWQSESQKLFKQLEIMNDQ